VTIAVHAGSQFRCMSSCVESGFRSFEMLLLRTLAHCSLESYQSKVAFTASGGQVISDG
jgi:hypothetical protein